MVAVGSSGLQGLEAVVCEVSSSLVLEVNSRHPHIAAFHSLFMVLVQG